MPFPQRKAKKEDALAIVKTAEKDYNRNERKNGSPFTNIIPPMTRTIRSLVAFVLLSSLLLSACGQKAAEPATGSGTVIDTKPKIHAPIAPLSLFIDLYLSTGMLTPATSARNGVDALMRLSHAGSGATVNEAYALLEQLASVLLVNIPDLLNRSADRAATLNQYSDALNRTNEASQKEALAIKASLDDLKAKERTLRTTVTDLQRTVDLAVKAKDFTTAGENQKSLSDAQTALTGNLAEQKTISALQKSYNDLLGIAAKRIQAIAQNREILIAGLKVVSVPGVEDLGILQGSSSPRSTLGTGF
jgi:hypothetical protein